MFQFDQKEVDSRSSADLGRVATGADQQSNHGVPEATAGVRCGKRRTLRAQVVLISIHLNGPFQGHKIIQKETSNCSVASMSNNRAIPLNILIG